MKVSLVATVKNANPFIHDFLDSVRAQTRQPDEVILVDGGSTDGTWEALQEAEGIQTLSEPGANIARGRNLAVKAATHDVIAVTDADCVLAPDWLERILEPLERGAEVSAGFYKPIGDSLLQVLSANPIPVADELGPGWMPSSRSLAFRREMFEAAGGYPEWLDVGEDMYLNHRWVDLGVRMELAPEAIVHWRMRPTLAETWRQYAGYAEGDARAGMYPRRHALRFATYGAAAVILLSKRRWLMVPAAVAGAAYAARPLRRTWRRLPESDRWKSLAGVPALMAFTDAAKMWGYLRGLARRS